MKEVNGELSAKDKMSASFSNKKSVYIKPFARPSIERLRIVLMLLMFFNLFGFPNLFGELLKTVFGFVSVAFFILSGYLVLRESEDRSERILRAIKRTATAFSVTAVVYLIINLIYYRLQGVSILPALAYKRFWFNLFVMNVWQFDIGGAIWYVQALLYAYIIIYFLDKWNLLRFDGIISAVLILITVLTGELSGIIRWEVLGYQYLVGNFFTRALPYILLGSFISRKMSFFSRFKKSVLLFGIFAGVLMMLGEILVLDIFGVMGYYGHLIGMPVVAVSMCLLAFGNDSVKPGFERKLHMSREYVNIIYYLCQPVSVIVLMVISTFGESVINKLGGFVGIFTFIICFILAWLISLIAGKLFKKKAPEIITKIKFAGIPMEICHITDSLPDFEEYKTDEAPLFTVRISEEDIVNEQGKIVSEYIRKNKSDYPVHTSEKLENSLIHSKIASHLPKFDALFFRGTAVEIDGKAYVFASKSGTDVAKYTKLLIKNFDGSSIIFCEKPVLRIIDEKPFVFTSPWSGKKAESKNMSLPLYAVCLLSRSENNITEKSEADSILPHLTEFTHHTSDSALADFTERLLNEIGQSVSLYNVTLKDDEEAAVNAFNEII